MHGRLSGEDMRQVLLISCDVQMGLCLTQQTRVIKAFRTVGPRLWGEAICGCMFPLCEVRHTWRSLTYYPQFNLPKTSRPHYNPFKPHTNAFSYDSVIPNPIFILEKHQWSSDDNHLIFFSCSLLWWLDGSNFNSPHISPVVGCIVRVRGQRCHSIPVHHLCITPSQCLQIYAPGAITKNITRGMKTQILVRIQETLHSSFARGWPSKLNLFEWHSW